MTANSDLYTNRFLTLALFTSCCLFLTIPASAGRPQDPIPPYPYQSEDVVFDNATDGVRLAGTLTYPDSGGPFPAVVLISGSGWQNRDGTLEGHRLFLVLADYLTRHGIAVLRYDDRGAGQSTGDFSTATTLDFAEDATAGIAFLQTRPEVDKTKIGLIGHSEGGVVAPIIAADSADAAFIVLLAGPGLPGGEIILLQSERIARADGISEEVIADDIAVKRDLFEIVRNEPVNTTAQNQFRLYFRSKYPSLSSANINQLVSEYSVFLTPWFRFFLFFDPRPTLTRVKCPVLALNGEKDLQVPSRENLSAIEEALQSGGNTRFVTQELPGLNHLFQTANTGSPYEYETISETMAPSVLDQIARWILEQTRPAAVSEWTLF